MTARGAFVALVLAVTAASTVAFVETMEVLDPSDLHAPADVNSFVLAAAKPTAEAPTGGDPNLIKAVTLGRNAKGEVVATSMQLLNDDQAPDLPAGTVAVMRVHHKGQCQPPNGSDAAILMKHIPVLVVDYKGDNVWELGYARGIGSIRLVEGPNDFGPAETANVDPKRYREYACEKYQ